jgi:hypothetical protein
MRGEKRRLLKLNEQQQSQCERREKHDRQIAQ